MIYRHLTPKLKELANFFPIVTLMGPRQSGKSTLVQAVFKDYECVNLELKQERELAQNDPVAFFKRHPAPLIIDEVQRVPELLEMLQVIVDKNPKKGQYIITGSHQPALHQEISQSLAGRTAIIELFPLSIAELKGNKIDLSREECIFKGFMPRIFNESVPPDLMYQNYFSTYVERDVRKLINVSDINTFERFLMLLAGRVGQILNLSSLANEVGVSSTTLTEWLSVLEASYIVFRLPCFFNNFGKRLVKAPKIYFIEPGLAANLLGISELSQVERDPLFGNLFENVVVVEALKTRLNAGKRPELYYFRNNNGIEVDLILNNNRKIRPFEIKSSMTWTSSFSNNLNKFMKFATNAEKPSVIYSGDIQNEVNGIEYLNFHNISDIFSN